MNRSLRNVIKMLSRIYDIGLERIRYKIMNYDLTEPTESSRHLDFLATVE